VEVKLYAQLMPSGTKSPPRPGCNLTSRQEGGRDLLVSAFALCSAFLAFLDGRSFRDGHGIISVINIHGSALHKGFPRSETIFLSGCCIVCFRIE
jgi:hypothetical protein